MEFLLHAEELPQMQAYLREKKWIGPDEDLISAKVPGEGNMNYTLRIRTSFRTFILKQSRAYVEKYPHVPAPKERAVIEGQFYEMIQEDLQLHGYTPELIAMDPENNLLQLEDLGDYPDFTFLYKEGKVITDQEIEQLAEFLSLLHGGFNTHTVEPEIENRAMRELNAEHIFTYPYLEENGFDLHTITPGLQEVAMIYKTDDKLKSRLAELRKLYLENGPTLLHGDFYPGSWMQSLYGVKVIDPEFGFFGPAEFDLSVWRAHFMMAGQSEAALEKILKDYQYTSKIDPKLMHALSGVEILRRLIGLAQLPLELSLEKKEHLLRKAHTLVMN